MIDLSCDMGEGMDNDALIMPYIQSVNIACGVHAGDQTLMQTTVELAMAHGVKIGAHPSLPGKENFGREEMNLPGGEIYELVKQQIQLLEAITSLLGTKIHHVKPHGALYNMSARDASIARSIARAVKDASPGYVLFGLSGTHSIIEAQAIGLKTANEGFADRGYQDDGSLTPRSQPRAMITDTRQMLEQVIEMVVHQTVTSVNGKKIPMPTDTICIHGDGEHAVEFARAINLALKT